SPPAASGAALTEGESVAATASAAVSPAAALPSSAASPPQAMRPTKEIATSVFESSRFIRSSDRFLAERLPGWRKNLRPQAQERMSIGEDEPQQTELDHCSRGERGGRPVEHLPQQVEAARLRVHLQLELAVAVVVQVDAHQPHQDDEDHQPPEEAEH